MPYHFSSASKTRATLQHLFLSIRNLCKVRYIKLLINKNQTLNLMLHHFARRYVNEAR